MKRRAFMKLLGLSPLFPSLLADEDLLEAGRKYVSRRFTPKRDGNTFSFIVYGTGSYNGEYVITDIENDCWELTPKND